MSARFIIETIAAEPLSVPLLEPFVIATGRVDVTQSVLVTARVRDATTGDTAEGLGESAALPPVTRETQKDALFAILAHARAMNGLAIDREDLTSLALHLEKALPDAPVARAGVETAVLDAIARLAHVPAWRLLQGSERSAAVPSEITTDITIPIGAADHMAALGKHWWALGFRSFKIKVGHDVEADISALHAIHESVPAATFRLDANAAYATADALALVGAAQDAGIVIECFEQPCGRLALEAMAEVTERITPPVIADESVSTLADLERVVAATAAKGINLKLAKSGGLLRAYELGRAARGAGLLIMVGGMVETRLGITAAAHLVAALGGVEFPDLDTPWLLADDPFLGGYAAQGPVYSLPDAAGFGVSRRT